KAGMYVVLLLALSSLVLADHPSHGGGHDHGGGHGGGGHGGGPRGRRTRGREDTGAEDTGVAEDTGGGGHGGGGHGGPSVVYYYVADQPTRGKGKGKGFGGMKALLKAGDDALKGMKDSFYKAGDYAKKGMDNMKSYAVKGMNNMYSAGGYAMKGIKDGFDKMKGSIKKGFDDLGSKLSKGFGGGKGKAAAEEEEATIQQCTQPPCMALHQVMAPHQPPAMAPHQPPATVPLPRLPTGPLPLSTAHLPQSHTGPPSQKTSCTMNPVQAMVLLLLQATVPQAKGWIAASSSEVGVRPLSYPSPCAPVYPPIISPRPTYKPPYIPSTPLPCVTLCPFPPVPTRPPCKNCPPVPYRPTRPPCKACPPVTYTPTRPPCKACPPVTYRPTRPPCKACPPVTYRPTRPPCKTCPPLTPRPTRPPCKVCPPVVYRPTRPPCKACPPIPPRPCNPCQPNVYPCRPPTTYPPTYPPTYIPKTKPTYPTTRPTYRPPPTITYPPSTYPTTKPTYAPPPRLPPPSPPVYPPCRPYTPYPPTFRPPPTNRPYPPPCRPVLTYPPTTRPYRPPPPPPRPISPPPVVYRPRPRPPPIPCPYPQPYPITTPNPCIINTLYPSGPGPNFPGVGTDFSNDRPYPGTDFFPVLPVSENETTIIPPTPTPFPIDTTDLTSVDLRTPRLKGGVFPIGSTKVKLPNNIFFSPSTSSFPSGTSVSAGNSLSSGEALGGGWKISHYYDHNPSTTPSTPHTTRHGYTNPFPHHRVRPHIGEIDSIELITVNPGSSYFNRNPTSGIDTQHHNGPSVLRRQQGIKRHAPTQASLISATSHHDPDHPTPTPAPVPKPTTQRRSVDPFLIPQEPSKHVPSLTEIILTHSTEFEVPVSGKSNKLIPSPLTRDRLDSSTSDDDDNKLSSLTSTKHKSHVHSHSHSSTTSTTSKTSTSNHQPLAASYIPTDRMLKE
ncbi:hypothetical protein Pcinc_043313, partial [Petrolisthes cinctipes]